MAAWWGIGQLIAGFFAWAFLPNFSCQDPSVYPDAVPCTRSNNQGWRYVWYASGSLVFVMSIARITVIRLKETPKFLVGEGRDAECVETLQYIAEKYGRPCSLTLERMQACGTTDTRASQGKSKWGLGGVWGHIRGLYATRRIGISTTLIWLSWTLIGLAYPLYNVFLPAYLSSRGAAFGEPSPYITWRNYTLVNFSGIWGPVLAGWMCGTKLGRKYTMVIGALVTMAFFFAYTQVRTATQNVSLDIRKGFNELTCVGCVHVHHQLLLKHILRHAVCVHARSLTKCAQGNWKRYCNWVEPYHGYTQRCHCDGSGCKWPLPLNNLGRVLTRVRPALRYRSTSALRCTSSWLALQRSFPSSRTVGGARETRGCGAD